MDCDDDGPISLRLSDRRAELVALRTQAVCRPHRLLVELTPGGLTRKLGADKALRTLALPPFAMNAIRKSKGLKSKRFAVIADEAHSSQTGATANKLKEVLTADELADIADAARSTPKPSWPPT